MLRVEVLLDLTLMHVVWCVCPDEFINLSFTQLHGSCGSSEASFFAAFSNLVSPFKGFWNICLWGGSLITVSVNGSTDQNCWFTSMSSKVHESSNVN